jgi:hypothetical protein
MLVQESSIDGFQGRLLGERNSKSPEPALETGIHKEGTGSGVHGADVKSVLDVLKRKLCAVIPMLVILVLTEESNSGLSVIFIEHGHVQVINELNELVFTERSESATSLLLKQGLELRLKQSRVSVIIEVNNLGKIVFSLGCHLEKETLDNLGLTATSLTNKKR